MTEPSSSRAELRALRVELEMLSARQAREIEGLRSRLGSLEQGESKKAKQEPLSAHLRAEPPAVSSRASSGFAPLGAEKPRRSSDTPISAPRDEAPEPPKSEPAGPGVAVEGAGSFELRFGRVWLVRFGVVLLVTGLVLLGNHAYKNWVRELPAIVRLAFLFMGSLGLVGVGWRFTLKEGMRRFGEVLLGGGLAFFYWCVFAAHHVDRLRVIDSPLVASLFLLWAAGGIIGISLGRDAKPTAMLGILLASYSIVLQPSGWMSGFSNGVLSLAAVVLMRRPGWSGPGVVGMAGSYLAFFWWQLAGVSGASPGPAGLVFLAASWLMFALPGVAGMPGGFGASLSERGRAWFAGVNNGVFFVLVSWLWGMLGLGSFWMVPATLGLVLLALGVLTRWRSVSGSVHLVQGLALLSLALVLKLEGDRLAFALALESLLLAGAFLRFRKLPELAFSMLAQCGSMVLFLHDPDLSVGMSLSMILLVGAAGVIIRFGGKQVDESSDFQRNVLTAHWLALGMTTLMGVLFCTRLDVPWAGLVSLGVGCLLSLLALKVERFCRLVELRWIAPVFVLLGGGMLAARCLVVPSWCWLASFLVAGGSAVLWDREAAGNTESSKFIGSLSKGLAWWCALIVGGSTVAAVLSLRWDVSSSVVASAFLIPGLATMAVRVLACQRLATALALGLLLPLALAPMLEFSTESWHNWLVFSVPFAAAATLIGSTGGPVSNPSAMRRTAFICRSVMLLGWILAWSVNGDRYWLEILALSSAAIMLGNRWPERWGQPEAWIMMLMVLAGIGRQFLESRWEMDASAGLPGGWGMGIALVVICLFRSTLRGSRRHTESLFGWLAASVVVLWSTLFAVQSFGWSPVVILWSGLGFSLVMAGLWTRLAAWRYAGFMLLAIAMLRLFAVDVWDFSAFTRVIAFLALGVAMVLLGFFYNRFAAILKQLLEGEAETRDPSQP